MMTSLVYVLLGMALMAALYWMKSRRMGFIAQRPKDYDGVGRQLDLRQHLNGPIVCEGVIYGPTGRVSSSFVADMEVSWNGNVGVMKERFHYNSGDIHDRQWTLTVANDGSVKAEADDVVGSGTGKQSGNALELKYRIKLPEASGGHELDAIDWMYLVDNGTIMNRSQFRKYGIKVAELVATMRPKVAA